MLLLGFVAIGFAGYRKSRWSQRDRRHRATGMDKIAAGDIAKVDHWLNHQ
jgi:hypothetical protein